MDSPDGGYFGFPEKYRDEGAKSFFVPKLCNHCATSPCVQGCPVQIRIREFIGAIAEGDYAGALRTIKENSLLPATCIQKCNR